MSDSLEPEQVAIGKVGAERLPQPDRGERAASKLENTSQST